MQSTTDRVFSAFSPHTGQSSAPGRRRRPSPAGQTVFAATLRREEPTTEIDAGESAAHSIGGAASTRRGCLVLEQSASSAVSGSEATSETTQTVLSRAGHEQESSVGAGANRIAATGISFGGPVIVLACSADQNNGTSWTVSRIKRPLEAV
ncbi:MAG: hypothetical protein J07HX5_01141, partial [halophilic archaeon J07HX5]